MPLEDFIIFVFCWVDEKLKSFPTIRQRGSNPKLSDAEVITMEIVGEFLGFDTDKHMWQYFKHHWLEWFPQLGSRSNFVRQSANLWNYKKQIQKDLAVEMGTMIDDIHMIDGLPIPVCRYGRARRCKIFKNLAAFGYCASKDEKYYGFHGHLVVNFEGIISSFDITAANVDEREAMIEITEGINGLLIGDKGYISREKKEFLKEYRQIDLQTPFRGNMKDERNPVFVSAMMKVRRRIETVIGQLSEQFHIEKVRARDLWHLTNRFVRKILAHTMAAFANRMLGRPVLHFSELLQI
jgi:IS5 family transposase